MRETPPQTRQKDHHGKRGQHRSARQQQRKEAGAEDGGLLPLACAKDAAEPGLLAEAGHRPLHLPDGRSVADLAQAVILRLSPEQGKGLQVQDRLCPLDGAGAVWHSHV